MVEETECTDKKIAFLLIAIMLGSASNGARSPLLDELHTRLPKSGGDGSRRTNNALAIALVMKRMLDGDSKTKAIDYAHEVSGISCSHLKRAFHGTNIDNIESNPEWETFREIIVYAMNHNPQRKGEDIEEWRYRLERWLIDGMSVMNIPEHDWASLIHEIF